MTTLNRMVAIWQSQPRSEKVFGLLFPIIGPVLFLAIWVALP